MKNIFGIIWKALIGALALIMPWIVKNIVPLLTLVDVIKAVLKEGNSTLEDKLLAFLKGDGAKIEETLKLIIDGFLSLGVTIQGLDDPNISYLEKVFMILDWFRTHPIAVQEALFPKLIIAWAKPVSEGMKDHQLQTTVNIAYSLHKDGHLNS